MKLTNKKILSFTLLSAFILLSIIPAVRFISNSPILTGDNPYYHLRIAEYIKENSVPKEDPWIERAYIPQIYHILLSFKDNLPLFSIIIPFICGLTSLVVFYIILKKLKIETKETAAILLAAVLSPLFIFTFGTSTHYAITILLMLCGFLFFQINLNRYFILSLIFLAAMPFFGIFPTLITILTLLIYTLNNKDRLKDFYIILSTTTLILLIYQVPLLFYYGISKTTKLLNHNILVNWISDLGGSIGFGIFTLLLATIGLTIIWKKEKQITGYILLLLTIFLSFHIPELTIYLAFPLYFFAGLGFTHLINMKWKIDLIKQLTILLIICGLIFSTLSYINEQAVDLPDKEIINSLKWLRENSDTEDIIFSHHSKGHWIEYFSNRPVVIDSEISYLKDAKSRVQDTNTLLNSRNLKTTSELLKKYNIKYIYIDNKMKTGQVWAAEEQGLLFLFRNKETFKQIYNKNNIEIWEVLIT